MARTNTNTGGGAGVTSVAGTLVDNTNPAIPVISIFTDPTITGLGTAASPLAVAGGLPVGVYSAITGTTTTMSHFPVYNNGVAGVGATLTSTGNHPLPTIGGVTNANMNVGDRIMVRSGDGGNPSNTIANGLYTITDKGSAGTPWILTRSTVADTPAELNDLTIVIAQGTLAGTIYDQTATIVTIGVQSPVFTQAASFYVKQNTAGTQSNFNIPTWKLSAGGSTKFLERGTTDFQYDPTAGVTEFHVGFGGVKYLKIDAQNQLYQIGNPGGTSILVNDATQLISFSGNYTFPFADGNAGEALITDGAGTVSFSPVASVAGLDTQIQYNNTGAFAGDANFTWDYTNLIFSVGDSALLGNGTFITMDDTARRTTIGEDFTVKHAVTNKRFINTDFVGTGEYSFGFIDASAGGSLQTFMKVSTQGGSSKFDFTTDPGVAAVQFTIDKEFVQRYGGVIDHVTVVTAAGPYAVLRTDYNIVINQTVGAAMTVNLPAAPVAGDTYQIKDGKGDANANTITVVPNAGTIDGLANFVMNIAYQANTFIYNGTEWNIF